MICEECSEPSSVREYILVISLEAQGAVLMSSSILHAMKKKYPDMPNGRGIPLTGLSNARPETLAIKERVQRNIDELPFDIDDVIELDIPGGKIEGDWGR